MEKIDYRAHLEDLRSALSSQKSLNTEDALNLMTEAMFACVMVVKDNLENQGRGYENAKLAKELLGYANHLMQFEHPVDAVQNATMRMAEYLCDHPRLKLELMCVQLSALHYIENREMHDLGITEDLRDEITRYRRNIEAADKGDFASIVNDGFLKKDPIEWTARWEEVIDEVNEIVDARLSDCPRGMGFCFAYWSEKATVLREKFGIEWRSPSLMNPGVIFD